MRRSFPSVEVLCGVLAWAPLTGSGNTRQQPRCRAVLTGETATLLRDGGGSAVIRDRRGHRWTVPADLLRRVE